MAGTRHAHVAWKLFISFYALVGLGLLVYICSLRTWRGDDLLAFLTVVTLLASGLIGLVIGFKQSDDTAVRALSIYFVSYVINQAPPLAPPSFRWAEYMWGLTIWLIWGGLVVFAVLYQPRSAGSRRRTMARWLPAYLTCAVIGTAYYTAQAMNYTVPYVRVSGIVLANANSAIVLFALWDAWYNSSGEQRQRQLWLLLLLGFRTIVTSITFLVRLLPQDLQTDEFWHATLWFQREGTLFVIVGLAYAILRFRVLNVSFAINRALVYTIVSSILLLAFSVSEWAVDKLLHFQGREKNAVVDALVALGIILSFHRIQHWVSHYVDHVVFRRWHAKAKKLRHFLERSTHISDASIVQARFADAINDYADAGGCAIYVRDANGGMRLSHSTLFHAPNHFDMNDDLVIELRHRAAVVDLGLLTSQLPAALAFPLVVRGRLEGVLLLGHKDGEQTYRPDEIALVESGARQLGLDLETLKAEELQARYLVAAQRSASLEALTAAQQGELVALRKLLETLAYQRAVQ